MHERFSPPEGLCVEALGDTWVAFSPMSGETLVLNNECAAILEVLAEAPSNLSEVCAVLAADHGDDAAQLREQIGPFWAQMISSGLIKRASAAPTPT